MTTTMDPTEQHATTPAPPRRRRRGDKPSAKAPKPVQDRKTDLPVVGLQTVRNVAAVGLAGIAVEAGGALIVDKLAVGAEADKLGLFVVGVSA